MSARPPRVAEWLLQRGLDAEAAEAVCGDLEEAFQRRAAKHGAWSAAYHYWGQALRSWLVCRITGRRRSDERWLDFGAGPATVRDRLRPALRQFRDQPFYAFTCVATLALAVGVACASVAVAKHALFDALPYARDEALVSVLTSTEGRTFAVSAHVLRDLQQSGAPLVDYAPIRPAGVAVRAGDVFERVGANFVTPDYFRLLGITPLLGRVLTSSDRDAVVISWSFWQQALSADPDILGRRVLIDDAPHTVVGVMPQGFMPIYWPACHLWTPLDIGPLLADPARGRRTLTVLARRAEGTSQSELDAFLTVFSGGQQQRYPAVHGKQSWVAPPLRDELVGAARPALTATAAAAVVLLLIVTANIAGLAAARAVATRHDLAIRAALGATGGRLFVEQLVDSLVIAAVGTLAGLGLAAALVQLFANRQRQFLDRLTPVDLDLQTVIAGLAVGMTVGVVAALVPRRLVHALGMREALHASRGEAGAARGTRTRAVLVVGQVALAVVMLAGAGLLIRSVAHLTTMPLGFRPEQLTTFQVTLPGERYAPPEAQITFEDQVVARLAALPGVEEATASVGIPVIGGMMASFGIYGRPADSELDEIAYFSVAPGFMRTAGARLVAGRDLDPTDHREAPRVVLINETMARMFWPAGDALGARVQIGAGDPGDDWITVVGIVGDLRQHGPTEAIRPTAFGSTRQYTWASRYFTVRTGARASLTLAMDIREAVRSVDPTLALGAITPITELIDDRTARARLVRLVLTLFGFVALVLSVSGLYAVVALTSRVRRREYAIRLALGASQREVRWLVIGQALALSGAGVILGLAAAAGATRGMSGLLHGVPPLDPLSHGSAAAALLALALVAAWRPARQAGRANPAEVLKSD